MKITKDKIGMCFNVVSKKIIEKRKEVCKNFDKFREYYFKDYHTCPDADFHKELCKLLSTKARDRGAKIAIAAPRDSAKSTIVSLEYVVYCVCYKLEDFIVITSSTSDQAVDFLSHVKKELECNERLCQDFSEVCEIGEKPKPPRWTQKEIATRNGVKVIALGTGQQIRGRRNRSARPSLIILDDIETGETAQNPENFEKLEDWLTKSVLKAGTSKTNVVYVGTIHHYNSLLAKFTNENDYPGWHKWVLKSIISWSENQQLWQKWNAIFSNKESYNDLEGNQAALSFFEDNKKLMLKGTKVLWPNKLSYYELMVMREKEGHYSFDSEMQNEPTNPADCCFPAEILHFWEDNFESEEKLLSILAARGNYVVLGACDPSMGKPGVRGHNSAITTVIKDCTEGKLYVLDMDISKRHPNKIIEDIIEYHRHRHYSAFAFEAIQAQEFIGSQLEDLAISEGVPMNVVPVRPQTDKIARIQSLQPLIKQGIIQLSRKHFNLLEELKYFPKGRFDDGLDALEMVYQLSKGITGGGSSYPAGSPPRKPTPLRDCLIDVPDVRYQMLPGREPKRGKNGDRFVPEGW